MSDFFFYRDLVGKRRLRCYVKAALVVEMALSLTLSACALAQGEPAAEVPQTPQPVAITVVPTNTPVPPTPTFTPPPSPTPEACPTDPARWEFTLLKSQGELFNKGWYRISPPCVYDGLAKSVAWVLLVSSMGYTGPEATQALGFEQMPLAMTSRIIFQHIDGARHKVYNSFGVISVTDEYRFWRLDEDGKATARFWLQGCYRTEDIVGNHAESWAPYPVMCVVYWHQGYTLNWIYVLGESHTIRHSKEQKDSWSWHFFVYSPDRGWLYVGGTDYGEYKTSYVGSPCTFCEETLAEHGVPLWDANWLKQTYSLEAKPLPEGWSNWPERPPSDEDTDRWWSTLWTFFEKDWWEEEK